MARIYWHPLTLPKTKKIKKKNNTTRSSLSRLLQSPNLFYKKIADTIVAFTHFFYNYSLGRNCTDHQEKNPENLKRIEHNIMMARKYLHDLRDYANKLRYVRIKTMQLTKK